MSEKRRVCRRVGTLRFVPLLPTGPKGPFLYPELCGYETLKEIEDNPTKGPYQLSAQYLMNPIVAGMGLISDVNQLQWTPRSIMDQLLPRMFARGGIGPCGNGSGLEGERITTTPV